MYAMMTAAMMPFIAVVCYDDCSDDAIHCCCMLWWLQRWCHLLLLWGYFPWYWQCLYRIQWFHDGITSICASWRNHCSLFHDRTTSICVSWQNHFNLFHDRTTSVCFMTEPLQSVFHDRTTSICVSVEHQGKAGEDDRDHVWEVQHSSVLSLQKLGPVCVSFWFN